MFLHVDSIISIITYDLCNSWRSDVILSTIASCDISGLHGPVIFHTLFYTRIAIFLLSLWVGSFRWHKLLSDTFILAKMTHIFYQRTHYVTALAFSAHKSSPGMILMGHIYPDSCFIEVIPWNSLTFYDDLWMTAAWTMFHLSSDMVYMVNNGMDRKCTMLEMQQYSACALPDMCSWMSPIAF